jgi:sugar-specific transcriptional regulator TrmB
LKTGAIEKALKNFGLSDKEIEVYIFLGKRGALKGVDITKQLKIHKAQVYRALKSLQKKGLVEVTLEYPARFTAVPFENLIDSFIKTKKQEVEQIEKTKNDLLSDWNKISQNELNYSLEKFSIIEGTKKIFNKIVNMAKQAKREFIMVSTFADVFRADRFGIFDIITPSNAKSKIQYKFLSQLSKQNLKIAKIFEADLNPIVNFRVMDSSLGLTKFSRMAIRDNEEILLFISEENEPSATKEKEVCLHTNCKAIIQSYLGVFNDLWRDSRDLRQLILELETGKVPPKTQIFKNPEIAKDNYNKSLAEANSDILMILSSEGLIKLSEEEVQLEKWAKKELSIKIMAPIINENLNITHQLLKWCEVRHIPLGYFETTIIDDHHLFQFTPSSAIQNELQNYNYFDKTFYTNDPDYIQKTKQLLLDIWKKTRTPSSGGIRSITRTQGESSTASIGHHSLVGKSSFKQNMKYNPKGKITTKDVFDKIEKEKRLSLKYRGSLFEKARFFGSSAAAVIHSPESYELPDMNIFASHNDEYSSFSEQNWLLFLLKQEIKKKSLYVPVAFASNNPDSVSFYKKVFSGFPAQNNILVFNKDEIQVRSKGKTLFAGWTKPIPLGVSDFVVPPSCLLFEGYGEINSGMLTNIASSGRRQERWFNSFDAFVSYFHPESKYVGSGTEGFIERDTLLISTPVKTDK